MVSGFALPLYLVISFIGMVALSLMLPHPLYVPGVKLVRVPPLMGVDGMAGLLLLHRQTN